MAGITIKRIASGARTLTVCADCNCTVCSTQGHVPTIPRTQLHSSSTDGVLSTLLRPRALSQTPIPTHGRDDLCVRYLRGMVYLWFSKIIGRSTQLDGECIAT
jgi:hypothetical protein